ncbi:MAG TPA: DUF1854 domain-containing protein [Isosphaeraceae bacterium]|jgi:hypothetical protein|nr:DUF1854 domain-containing protein [Isosphaeraceae bacterium]
MRTERGLAPSENGDHAAARPAAEPAPASRDGEAWFSLARDAWGHLVLVDAEGKRTVGVEPVRAFPYSDPAHWISICDSSGREVVSVENLAELPSEVRTVLEEELALREFVPTIHRIVRVSSDSTPCLWDVETDRGPTRFTLNSEDDVRRLGPNRALVADSNGIRYLIPDTRALDIAGRRLLERYL